MMAEALHFAIFAAVKRHEPVDPAGVTAAAWAALTDVGPQGLPFLVEGPDVPPVAAPTMSAAGMIVLALVLALGGLVMVRRYS